MRSKAFFCLLPIFIASCTKEVKTKDSLLEHLPPNPSLVLKITNLTNFKSELKNNSNLKSIEGFSNIKKVADKIKGLEHLSTDKTCVLALYEVGKDNHDYILATKNDSGIFNVDSVSNKTVETLTYEETKVSKYNLDGLEVYSLRKNDDILLSSSMMLMENLIRVSENTPADPTLKKLYQASSLDKSATIFINPSGNTSLLALKEQDKTMDNPFSSWISLDFTANSDEVNLSGVAMAPDSTKNFINLFKGTSPLANKTPSYAPLTAQAILSYTFDDYQVFANNQNTYLDRAKKTDSLFNTIEEVGIIYLNKEKVVLLKSYGTESLYDYLESKKTASQDYQGSEIIELEDSNIVEEGFTPLVKDFESNFCTILENSFIFSEQKEALQTIISNHKSASSFDGDQGFKTAKASLASESSMLFVSNATGIDFFAEQELSTEVFEDVKDKDFKEQVFASQMVMDNGFGHFNLLVSKIEKNQERNTVSPLFTLELNTDLATDPQFVKNHRTKQQEIVVQDQNNVLYLISTDGKVLWTKQLDGRIQGEIQQVDIYKNGKLQLAFTTNDQFLILDRNGDEVPPFTIDFEGGNLNPLAVFDYDGSRNYRFVVTQGQKVYMYNNQGKIVRGFTFTDAPSNILDAPKHFRVGNKDYLVFKQDNSTLRILHRVGSDRIKVPEKIDFSSNEVFLYKNKFSVTNKTGVLHQIDTNGKLTATNFNLNPDHGFYATSNTLVFMDDNILSIKGKKVELELGVYSKPKIFYIYDKIYVGVTDIQNHQIYLYDSQAKPIPNFPVFGSSLIDLTDMDNDRRLELVAKDQENSLIVYKIN
ncbi:ribonuclease HII [Flagellimonas halotolerans]|uniref:Ribonuclease HII n=1 Tax=Flagellimonas halotolerans TaxID=3112164 RepID=A0ABU6ITQ4_9FLAO|nr:MULTISPECIES: ribonuclease HII [unclassified Allomuricauda]MEC3966535.1 ribonuclease HII [Muricauda sp. SYSU M86414]MEC4266328.1 ribonuclease HII [Muricauda sp. SYSU M84420]